MDITLFKHQMEHNPLMRLQEQHAEVAVARAVVSESYAATAARFAIPNPIHTGNFRKRKGDPIWIRPEKVINKQPWEAFLERYIPQYDRSLISWGYFYCYVAYSDFLMRQYTPRYRNLPRDVEEYLLLLTKLCSAEKIQYEKYLLGPEGFAYPNMWEWMDTCYTLRKDYALMRKTVYTCKRHYQWDEVRTEFELAKARREFREKATVIRLRSLPTPLPPLPSGNPYIVLLPEGEMAHAVNE